MTVKWPGITVELGGTEYVLPALPLSFIESNSTITEVTEAGAIPVKLILDALTAALQRNYPDMTRETVADLVDVSNMADLFELAMDAAGLRRKEGAGLQGKTNPVWDLTSRGWRSTPTLQPAPDGPLSTSAA